MFAATADLDLFGPLADAAPITVRPHTPADRAHALFVSLGLRHLPVVDAGGRVVGVITRKDLDAAAGAGPWRRSRIAAAGMCRRTWWR